MEHLWDEAVKAAEMLPIDLRKEFANKLNENMVGLDIDKDMPELEQLEKMVHFELQSLKDVWGEIDVDEWSSYDLAPIFGGTNELYEMVNHLEELRESEIRGKAQAKAQKILDKSENGFQRIKVDGFEFTAEGIFVRPFDPDNDVAF